MALKVATGQALQLPNSQRIWHHSGQPRYPASADGEAKHRLPSKSGGSSRFPMPGHYPVYLTSHSPPYLHCPDKGISPSSQHVHLHPHVKVSHKLLGSTQGRASALSSPEDAHGLPSLPVPDGALWPCSNHHHCGPSQTLSPNPMSPGTWCP